MQGRAIYVENSHKRKTVHFGHTFALILLYNHCSKDSVSSPFGIGPPLIRKRAQPTSNDGFDIWRDNPHCRETTNPRKKQLLRHRRALLKLLKDLLLFRLVIVIPQ